MIDDSVEGRMLELEEKKRKLMKGAFTKKQTVEERSRTQYRDVVKNGEGTTTSPPPGLEAIGTLLVRD